MGVRVALGLLVAVALRAPGAAALRAPAPAVSLSPPANAPARSPEGLENRYWGWRGQRIRYQRATPARPNGRTVVLVHGLFVNADHWRRALPALAAAGVTAYAVDLLGSGWSSRPFPTSPEAAALSGEVGRPEVDPLSDGPATLGTAGGGTRAVGAVPKAHPVAGSCYNFYTWAEQLCDFSREVVALTPGAGGAKATLVCNSIGCVSGLQAALDAPGLFDGVLCVSPNFRELHVAEAPALAMPAVRAVQSLLRAKGQGLFDALAKPGTVKQILKEPYAVGDAVDDDLVDVLLSPLLEPGAADVVFDALSYSAGPLPEPQLDALDGVPVWVCYGSDDPWTPPARVEALAGKAAVERVLALDGVGHCPHDEAPERVNPFILSFLDRLAADDAPAL